MIVSNQFVIINYPKTGTTFLRKALQAIHRAREEGDVESGLTELFFPKLYGDCAPDYADQHAVYRQIPSQHKHKPVISTVRNPLDRYLSSFLFGWWKKHPPLPMKTAQQLFPAFPDLSFPEYYDLLHHPLVNEDRLSTPGIRDYGSYTRMFLVFYALDPEAAAGKIVQGQSLECILPSITFLHQENLRQDLSDCLLRFRYTASEIQLVHDVGNQNCSSREQKASVAKQDLAAVAASVLKRDEPLLDRFPVYKKAITEVASG